MWGDISKSTQNIKQGSGIKGWEFHIHWYTNLFLLAHLTLQLKSLSDFSGYSLLFS